MLREHSSRLIVMKSERYRPGCEPTRNGFKAYAKRMTDERNHRLAVVHAVINGLPIPTNNTAKSKSSSIKVDISNEVTF